MIGDPPRLVVKRGFARLQPDELAPFADCGTAFLADAMQGRGALAARIKPIDPASRFVGSALTVRAGARDNLAAVAALDLVRPGDVLVIAAQGFAEAAVVGDKMTRIAQQRGAAAIVTDGAVRDTEDLLALGLPVFAAHVSPNSAYGSGPGEVGLPIALGEVAIAAGDLVLGDRDGVIVVPRAELAAVRQALDRVAAREADLLARIADGRLGSLLSPELQAAITYVD